MMILGIDFLSSLQPIGSGDDIAAPWQPHHCSSTGAGIALDDAPWVVRTVEVALSAACRVPCTSPVACSEDGAMLSGPLARLHDPISSDCAGSGRDADSWRQAGLRPRHLLEMLYTSHSTFTALHGKSS